MARRSQRAGAARGEGFQGIGGLNVPGFPRPSHQHRRCNDLQRVHLADKVLGAEHLGSRIPKTVAEQTGVERGERAMGDVGDVKPFWTTFIWPII